MDTFKTLNDISKNTDFAKNGGISGIVLNKKSSEEFFKYGILYYNEAKRIVTHMPRLPKKFKN
jgi:hypothetical protein